MRSWLLAAGALAAGAAPAAAQARVEWQGHALTTVADADFVGGGIGAGVRTGARLRLGVTLSAGILDEAAAGRAEALATFLLNPARRGGVLVYGGGGAAVTFTDEAAVERLVVLLGLEQAPATGVGWFLEGGVAGGVRAAAGIRIRPGRDRGR